MLTRRDLFRAAKYAVGTVAIYALNEPCVAYAIAGVDDVALGGLVLLVGALGGYTFTSMVENASTELIGKGFGDFVSTASNRAAAVAATLQAAQRFGVEMDELRAQAAAEAIANGQDWFASAMATATQTGRLALDGVVSGATETAGVLRNLVYSYLAGLAEIDGSSILPGSFAVSAIVTNNFSFDSLTQTNNGTVSITSIESILSGIEYEDGVLWAVSQRCMNGTTFLTWRILYGYGPVSLTAGAGGRTLNAVTNYKMFRVDRNSAGNVTGTYSVTNATIGRDNSNVSSYYQFSANMASGSVVLPGVDRSIDAPDVITPGYNSVPLGQDMVVDPETGAVTGAGSIALPTGIPDVVTGLNEWLTDSLGAVVPGTIALPVPISTPAVVATPDGITTMPIDTARNSDTSIVAPGYVPPPVSPIVPPVSVPAGPWEPAVRLPFEQVWPFNMVYSVLQMFQQLGG